MAAKNYHIFADFTENTRLRVFLSLTVSFLILIIVIFLAQTHSRTSIEEALAKVQDPILRLCIQEHGEKNNLEFTFEMDKLTCPLKLSRQGEALYIRRLTGLGQFHYLKELSLPNSNLGSLAELRHLKSLTKLNLSTANVFVITDLSVLSDLQELDLSDNSIHDPSPLASLVKLKNLNLENNNINDLNFLLKFRGLESLNLRSNLIKSISQLARLKQLKVLNLSNNQIIDVSSLVNLKNLRKLDLSYNQVRDIGALAGLSSLTDLNLGNNKIDNIEPLSKLYLQKVNLENNDSVSCAQTQVLEARLSSIENLDLLLPKVCTVDLQRKKKKRFWDLFKFSHRRM